SGLLEPWIETILQIVSILIGSRTRYHVVLESYPGLGSRLSGPINEQIPVMSRIKRSSALCSLA
ncbi:MAG: hypothetical protein JXL84_03605, partial [Deltaproteobacteria bacterium]|nr:hypothetical protein [Deltaproteobacteria bacterium]